MYAKVHTLGNEGRSPPSDESILLSLRLKWPMLLEENVRGRDELFRKNMFPSRGELCRDDRHGKGGGEHQIPRILNNLPD
jgi:hypothetical protein